MRAASTFAMALPLAFLLLVSLPITSSHSTVCGGSSSDQQSSVSQSMLKAGMNPEVSSVQESLSKNNFVNDLLSGSKLRGAIITLAGSQQRKIAALKDRLQNLNRDASRREDWRDASRTNLKVTQRAILGVETELARRQTLDPAKVVAADVEPTSQSLRADLTRYLVAKETYEFQIDSMTEGLKSTEGEISRIVMKLKRLGSGTVQVEVANGLRRTHNNIGQNADGANAELNEIGRNVARGKYKGLVVGGVMGLAALGAIALIYFLTVKKDDPPLGQTKVKDDIVKGVMAPQAILLERCGILHASASRVEALGEDAFSVKGWKFALDSLGPVYDSAVKQATESGNTNLTMRGPEDWSRFNTFNFDALTGDSSFNQKNTSSDDSGQDQAIDAYLRTVYLKYHYTQQHYEKAQDVALNLMVGSTDLPFETNSEHFYRAYTAIISRVSIPNKCLPHIHEDRSIIQQYTKSRAMHAILQVQTQTELDAHFARSGL